VLSDLMPFDQKDLTLLYKYEPWLNRNDHVRYYADCDHYNWTSRIQTPWDVAYHYIILEAERELACLNPKI
jgi:hypothetical protein